MADGDLLLSALAAGLLRNQTAAQTQTQTGAPPSGGVSIAQFSPEQISQLAAAIQQGIASMPAPQVNLPEINVPEISIPPIQATLSEEQISRLEQAVSSSGKTDDRVYDILNRSVQVDVTGQGIHNLVFPASGSYPNLVKLGSIQFIQDVKLVGIVLSASLLNTGTEPMGIFAARDTGNIINFASPADPTVRANDIYLSIVTHNNSTVGTNAPASRTSSIGFSPKAAAVLMRAGSAIAIYGCAQNLNSALLTGVLSVYYTTDE
jgi:hypothetical protein